MQPSLFIIGAQKAGTTTLYGYLERHPDVRAPLVKEVHYYDIGYGRGRRWYHAHFPLATRHTKGMITFDTTPYYMFHPEVAHRLLADFPDARVIALLRDPIARTWSHYWHEFARGFERLNALDAFRAERDRAPDPHNRVGATAAEQFAHRHFTYCTRSEYDVQLSRWRAAVAPRRLLVLKAEDLFSQPHEVLAKVAEFAELRPFTDVKPRALNISGGYPPPSAMERHWLTERLAGTYERLPNVFGETAT